MKIKNSLFPSFYLLLAFCLSLHAQAPDSLVGQTITFNYQGTHESGSVSFQFLSDDGGWMYDEHGGWDQMSYEWISSSNPQFLKILFSEGDVLDANLTFFDPTQGNSSFLYLETDENENLVVDDRGTATFSISNTLQSKSPPIGLFFEDDFSDVATTSSNFGFGDGDSDEGLTVVQNTSQGEYSLRGVFTDNDAEDSDDPDRWVEISAKTLLPMNRSWIVEAELFSDEFDYNGLQQIDYMRTAIEIDGSLANFHIGTSFNGQEFRHHAGIWNEVAQKYVSATKWIDPNAVSTTYRLVNNADDYELLFQVIETFDSGVSTYTTEFTLIHLEWDDGWYFKNDYNYPEGKYLDNWESIGDRYVQPELAFELPHSWSNGHGSELTMYDLQGGEIGFRRFSVQGDPEIIDFDDGDDVPAFYNNLLNEVGQGGSSSRYHLLKGLHELAQLVESTESDSLKQFAVSFGVEDSILDFSLADSPLAGTYEFELDREFHIGKLTAFAQNSLIPRLESIDNHFAQVTDVVTMETSMTGAEEEIIADATDVKVLRAMVNLLASLASLQSGYDWDLNAGYLQDLDMEVTETDLEEFREKHPGFLGVRSVDQLQKAQTFLQTAILVYKEASSGLRSSGRYATQADWLNNTEPDFLFVLDEYDFAEESEFIADLEELYDALINDYEITDDEEYSGTVISLSAFFNGGLDLPNLLPDSVGDQLSADQLTDPTIGGILPGATYANSLFLKDLREEFYEDELIVGQPVRHDSREDALQDFDYLTYLDLNEDLGDWFQTEASAKQHFYERGFWSERRYFYYPYESNSGSVENLVNDNLVGQKVSTSGIIADLSNLEFQNDYYFIDSVNVAVHYSSNDSSVMPEHWALEKYFFKRLSNESGSFVLINNAGEKLIANVSFQTSSSGTTNLRFIGNDGNAIWSQGSGSWNVSSLVETEIPAEIFLDSVTEDFAPYYLSSGLDGLSPSLESNDTFWPGYREQVTFDNYDGWKEFSANVTFPIHNGSEYEYGNGGFDYFKIDKNSAILTLRFNDPNNWNSDEKRFIYHLQFTDENRGVYVKYSDYITELDVTTGLFKFNNLSATARFAWEAYDNFESGTLEPRKWESGYFSGGQEPIFTEPDNMYQSESNLELKGNAFTGSDPIKVPNGSFWEEIGAATGSQGQSNSALFVKDESIIGIQARIQLPGNNSQQSGIYIAAPPSRVSLELVWRDQKEIPNKWGGFDSTSTYFDYYDDQDTTPSGGLKPAYKDNWYTVSAIRDNGRVSYFIDGEILSTFDAGNDNPKDWMIGAFNDNGEAFSAYVDDVRVLRRDREQVLIEEIYVSGGDLNYPHYSFSDDNGSTIDMEDFDFKPDTIYRFIAKDLSANHPFTIGISIGGSEIYKEILRPVSSVEYSNLPDLEFETLVMAPTDDDYGNNNILSSEGDYFDFSYTSELLQVLLQNDVKFHYVCDIHTSMNGQLFLLDIDTAKKVYVSGGSPTAPYYNFSNEEGPIDLSTYEFGAGEDYRFIAVEGFTPHAFAIGSAPSASSSYVSGGPLVAVGDELTLSIPPNFDTSTESLAFYCVAHPTTMNGYLRVIEKEFEDIIPVPVEQVVSFVEALKSSTTELAGTDPVWANKILDVIDENRFVYEVGLNNMFNLYFDQNGGYLHAANDYSEERLFIPNSEIAQSIKDLIASELPGSKIIDFESERSMLELPNHSNEVFFAIVENNESEMFEVVINGNGDGVIIVMPFEGYIPWRPVELPEVAVEYLADNYVYDDGYPMNYWEDQRPTPDGNSMEFVAYLEDGREVIFDEDGTFNREFNPWDIEEDAKLSFNPKRSAWGNDLSSSNFSENTTGGDGPAYVHIEKLNLSSSHNESEGVEQHTGAENWDDMIYRISLVNTVLGEDANLTRSALELGSTVLPAGTPLKLTFTYETGEPRYILLSGGKVRGFKRTWPEWDRPGSFTILAETVDAVSTSDGDLASTFGMVVVMGGERFYNGAIFQANVPVLDMMPSEMISPYEQVAGFSLVSETSADANISAFLPRDLLEWNFGISEPHRVKAGLMDENGSLLFINGSGADEEGAEFTGGGFTRIIHKGHEPDYQTYPQEGGEDEDYKLGDHDSDEGFIDEDEDVEEGVIKSRFDFNADGFGDSLLEVRFVANAFPAEVGFGDPYEDPYKDLNEENMGSITGSVLDEDGQVIPEFGLWFFQAQNGLDGPWEPAFFILDSNFSTGAYQAYLPEGDYYVEASGFDPNTGTPYKPQVSESSFAIDANSSHTLDFALEQDFVVSHEYGQVSSSLNISGLGSDDRLDISIELYPVEQNGSRITDYPTGWLWVEPNGEIRGEAPSGRYEVVLFSYDNSVRLSGGAIFWDITANQPNEFDALEASKAQPLEVSGVVYDANTSAGIWADIVFVDPSDEYREFWPQWEPVEFEDTDSYVEGSYRVKIPAGTYKIKAMRWDGLYQSEYYTNDGVGTTEFSDADSVVIGSDLTDVDFNLNGAPAAQVQVRIVDANTSNTVDFAWFAFFDAEDEYGPVVYPHVQEDDGNYSLKLPGGNYKVMVEAGGYEPKFLTSDADGNYTWDSADWASAASLSLTEENTTSLPLAELNAFAQEDHERYAFEWFDEDANITFGTISGKVVTTKGNVVPKARIVAHTDDYLFWFDHFETKVDGTYELNNLPKGNWIVFAEPPFESEEYLGYQSSKPNWDSPIAVDANITTDIKLSLQGSNVSGRIMYSMKNEDTGRVSLVGLEHAFLWVFQDENETGEPNYNHIEGEAFVFNEAYGETNEDGFFALSLPEAGKYSMRIELPGNLANLALAPVHFELKNPAKEMRLGNAIRIDWSKAEARATTYKLERKLTSASVYTALDDNISGSVKSYVDYTVVPGAAYDYKLTAVTANGSKAIGDSSYKVSKPFIYLAPPSNTISGLIRDDLNATITGAEVVAWRMDGEGWTNTFTETAGSYELSVGPGKWEVTVYRPWDQNVNWSYEKAPKTVTFANSSSKTTKTVNFTVNRMGDGKVVGTIDIPDGITDAASSIWIDVFSPDGIGNWANPESNGSFSIPLKPGQYELSVWLDPDKFKGYGSPEPQFIRISKTEVSVGTISLREFNSTISGVIATSSGSPLGNAEVWAWSETGGWTSDVTDTTGAFELKVAPGRWEVGFNPPIPADGSESPYLLEPPKRIKVGDGVKTLNFTVRKAASKVEGVVYGPSGAPVADLNAWAYAREAADGNNSDEFFNVLAEVALSPRGTFSFPGLPGTYTVGLWIPPGSEYAQPDEQTLTLSDAGVLTDENGTSMDKIEFTLAKVDSYVTGSLIDKDTNQSISGLVGEVYAMRTDGDGWQYAPIETNGTYSMLLPPGNWVVEYYLEYDEQTRNYPKASAQPLEVSIQQGATVEENFVLSAAGASISGSVVYDSNSSTVSESTLYVWAYREGSASLPEYWDEVETDDNGSFTISVLQGGKYEVGVILSNDLREDGYLEPAIQKFKMSTSTKTVLEFRLAQPAQDNYLSGTVVDGSGNSLAGAFVYAWTYDGRESSVYADSNGDFNMTVPSGALWKLGAEFSEFDANDTEILYFTENDVEADLRKHEYVSGISIVLARPEFEVPDGISITFDPSKDFVTTLPDGTEITIPGGAANVSSDVKTIRLVVTPTAKGLDKSGTDKPADYAYSMELFDDKGKEIEGNFKKDVVIRIPVDVDSFRNKGIDLDTLEGMYYSPTKKAWAKAKTSTFDQQSGKLTMTTDHFTVNSLVGQTAQSDLVADTNTSSLTGYDNWYQSDWLGSFFDASADKPDWVFHVEEKLGWMWVKTDAAGNYWFNHTTRGWLWTGADYFIEGDDTKSHFYSFSLGRWLYFHPTNGFYDYEANGGSYLD